MTKIKPAFKNTTKLAHIQEDFERATEYGPMWVGEDALYIFDFYDTRYIPLYELASIEMDVQDATMSGTCCNIATFTAHDVQITDRNGEIFRTKAIDPNKIHNAVQRILSRYPSLLYRVTGADFAAKC